MEELNPCRNPLCDHWVAAGILYCCKPCADAHKAGYEIHEDGILGHTEGCQERHAKRGSVLYRLAVAAGQRQHPPGPGRGNTLPPAERRQGVSVSLPPAVLAALDAYARAEGLDRSRALEAILRQKFGILECESTQESGH